MENKLPFYMAYPVPLLYNDDRNARRDYDYMKSIYPDTAKRVLPYMEEECDRMEYDGSMMYDEYPDRLQLRLMCRRIYDKAEKEVSSLCALSDTSFTIYPTSSRIAFGRLIPWLCIKM